MSDVIWRIRDWDRNFENSRTRAMAYMSWVPVPNKMDGDGYTALVLHENGAAHLGVWLALIEIASKCRPRGTLIRDNGRPHDAASLSRLSRLPQTTIQEAVTRLLSSEISWIEEVPLSELELSITEPATHHAPELFGDEPSLAHQTTKDDSPVVYSFPVRGGELWHLRRSHLDRLRSTFTTLDIDQQMKLVLEYLTATPTKRKTSAGMSRFLFSWLSNALRRSEPLSNRRKAQLAALED